MWLNQVANHLKSAIHCIKHQETIEIQEAVQAHMDMYQNPSKFEEIRWTE